jgi:hypothetical protein
MEPTSEAYKPKSESTGSIVPAPASPQETESESNTSSKPPPHASSEQQAPRRYIAKTPEEIEKDYESIINNP